VRLSKRALARQERYRAVRQLKRARHEARTLRNYWARVLRNVARGQLQLSAQQEQVVSVTRRIWAQQRTDHGKGYSVHAPEVECLAKGKVPKRYEFGCKVRIVTPRDTTGLWGSMRHTTIPMMGATLNLRWPR